MISDRLFGPIGFVLIVLLALILGGTGFAVAHSTERTVTITVKSLDDQSTGNGHQYLVFTTGDGVYKDTDSIWFGKFSSSNLFAELSPGGTYRCRTTGWRMPLFSSYRNLLSCTQVSR
jgi:hypothetical protein